MVQALPSAKSTQGSSLEENAPVNVQFESPSQLAFASAAAVSLSKLLIWHVSFLHVLLTGSEGSKQGSVVDVVELVEVLVVEAFVVLDALVVVVLFLVVVVAFTVVVVVVNADLTGLTAKI